MNQTKSLRTYSQSEKRPIVKIEQLQIYKILGLNTGSSHDILWGSEYTLKLNGFPVVITTSIEHIAADAETLKGLEQINKIRVNLKNLLIIISWSSWTPRIIKPAYEQFFNSKRVNLTGHIGF